MNFKMLKNDFKRNRAGNMALLLFMIFAGTLVVAATIVVTMLITSMTGMYKTAKPPHFLQMHKGVINQQKIDHFAASYEGIKAWQTVPMIDVYGDDLKVIGKKSISLSDCRLDIILVKQNKEYDLLLDENRNIIHVKQGEIGIPVILLDTYKIKLGDTVVLKANGITKNFKVTAFVHDAQMNSKLCSSTRMLISDKDFQELDGKVGEKEYLIEAYFTDSSMASGFQTAYENAGLPQEGQAVTYTIIFLLSAMTDIMMAMILILVSILLVMVAMLCIKYTVMTAMEEEIGEIGTMKAIGMSYKDIRNLYLTKYKMMVAAGIGFGYLLAFLLSNLFTGHVRNTFGREPVSFLMILLPILACALIYLITIHYCKKILKKLRKVTVVDSLVTGKGFSKKIRVHDGLNKSRMMPVNLLMSIREVFHYFGGFSIVFIVMVIVSGIIIIPMNLLNTMKSRQFITYMGSSMDDVLIEIDPGNNLESKYEKLKALLDEDTDVGAYKELKGIRVKTVDSENSEMNLHIDCGKNAGKELKYLEGKAPSSENDIALSKLNAEAIGKKTKDKIIVIFNDKQKVLQVSGIYQDVTSGGYTAKAIYRFEGIAAEKYQFTVKLAKGVDAKEKASLWSDRMGGGYNIEPMQEFINQTLGGVTRQVEIAATAVGIVGIWLTCLIVVLFMKLRLAKDVAQITAMKAIGFTNQDIRRQYLYKIGSVTLAGIIIGTVISNILGENLVSMMFGLMGLGITRVTFIINGFNAFIILPLILLTVALAMTWITTKQIKNYNIISLINE